MTPSADPSLSPAVSVSMNLQSVVAGGCWYRARFWFCWRFVPVGGEFLLSTVTTCMLSMRDCWKVNNSTQAVCRRPLLVRRRFECPSDPRSIRGFIPLTAPFPLVHCGNRTRIGPRAAQSLAELFFWGFLLFYSLHCVFIIYLFWGQNITATVGQDVILPCKAKDYMPFEVVEWSRNEAEVKYVLIFDINNQDLEVPEQSYKDRVDVVNMEEGDVSLKLNNVKPEDRGRYECYVVRETNRNKRDIQPVNTVHLQVLPGRGHIGLVLMVVAVFAMVAVFAVFFWKKRTVSPPQDETVDPLQA
ncbi:hypothetical protein CCH79_00020584 [Gambusia affinis]|uniref:Ig-like domain-containing protein n=1 Tax=Gambusia affinis TaxID=33528 RepID=A0A315VX85_GAMAF|nr:hypothetical protein CCH79_00020584 [Gambusia affinis]